MATAKLCSSGTLDAIKPEEGNDSIDTFIRQAIGKEPLIPYTRTADNPVQWIQLLHALDQQDIPGWPLLTPVKVQMQKCEKCSREFCSPINYRRHIRVHRRSLNVNKDTQKNRDLLAVFWDKISSEQAEKVVSFEDVMLKDIPGSSFVGALASAIHKPGIWALPSLYVKAANALLDIIHANPSRSPPISSQELFSILDDASENTFLCAGTADSVQKYVFDGETSENCLELKNVVACISFLFERQLVKVWIADKEAEAYRCQLLLVEEEEAAQKRQAALLEKKRQKKLRKEQKLKDQLYENMHVNEDVIEGAASAEASEPSSPSDSNSNPPDIPTSPDSPLEPTQPQINEPQEEDIEAQLDTSNKHIKQGDDSQSTKRQMVGPNGNWYPANNRWQAPSKSQRGGRSGFNSQPLKPEPTTHKPGPSKDRNLQNGTKIWTKKLKIYSDGGENPKPLPPSQGENPKPPPPSQGENPKPPLPSQGEYPKPPPSSQGENPKPPPPSQGEYPKLPPPSQVENSKPTPPSKGERCEPVEENNCVVMIGSISVTVKNSVAKRKDIRPSEALDKKNVLQKSTKAMDVQVGNSGMASKQRMPVHHGENKSGVHHLDMANGDFEGGALSKKVPDRILLSETSEEQSESIDSFDNRKGLPFSSAAAREFLAQRWEEAISSDHVRLVLSEPKPAGSSDVINRESSTTTSNALDPPKNQTEKNIQVKISKKPEKGVKIKYIPTQKAAA